MKKVARRERECKGLVALLDIAEASLRKSGFVLGSKKVLLTDDYSLNFEEAFAPVRDFFDENIYAGYVAQGKASYTTLIEPITRYYASVGRKVWVSREDSAFDCYIHDILSSLNQVGVAHVDPMFFMTKTRNRKMRTEERDILGIFGLAGLAEILSVPLRPMIPFRPMRELFFSAAVIVLPFAFLKGYTHYGLMCKEIEHLETASRATDTYLQHVWKQYSGFLRSSPQA